MADPNALLMGTGVPAVKFPVLKHTIRIDPITNVEASQQVDFKTRKPLFYDDGSPRMQIVVTGKTTERDASIDHDDGTRKLYVKGQMRQAVRDAVVAAEASGLETGGALAVQWVDEEDAGSGMNPKKVYVAQYRRPTSTTLLVNETTNQAAPEAAGASSSGLFASASGADLI